MEADIIAAAPLIHIGYHKTATTWMQRQLFMPAHGFQQICTHAEVFHHIVQPHGLRFDPRPMQDLILAAGVGPGKVAVISSEILSGHPFQGGQQSDVYADRLAQIAPDAKILISIRNQLRILPSVYMQYVLRGGTMPAARFFDGTQEVGYFGFSPQHFEYDLLVAYYQKLFGAANVYVLTQESLQSNSAQAAQDLAFFAGNHSFSGLTSEAQKPVGESYPEYTAGLLRRINHLQSSTLNPWPIVSLGHTPRGLYKLAGYLLKRPPLQGWLGGRKPVSDLVHQRFGRYFAASNQRLAEISCHPLDLTGYDGIAKP